MSRFDIEKFLTENQIEHKSANKQKFIEIKECFYCGSKRKLTVYVGEDKEKMSYGFSRCYKCREPGNFSKIIATVKNISEKEAYVIFIGRSKVSEKKSPFEIDVPTSIELKMDLQRKELEISQLPDQALPLGRIELDTNVTGYIKKRGLSIEGFSKLNCVFVPSDIESVFNLISENYKLYVELIKKNNSIEIFKKMLFSRAPVLDEDVLRDLPGIPPKVIEVCRLTVKLRGRIVFPVSVGTRTLGYVARDYTGTSKLKVMNSSGEWSGSLFWNFNLARTSKEVVICEGIFSAISCGVDRSIALLGKNINPSSDKIRLLKKLGAKIFYIYLDTGAEKDAESLKKTLMSFAEEVHIIKPPSVIKIARKLTTQEIDQINKKGFRIENWEDKYGLYSIGFKDHRAFKVALRLINSQNIPQNDRPLIGKSRKLSQLEKDLISVIADGDFLDPNDLGEKHNSKLINTDDYFSCN